ncbi:DUF2063 domain-containing protein [Paucibacter sp. KBW04]|uniref:HvfC/BufC N-terminal domain-containing protein n=1 Tax=Paucibacter sp. KBW04 TaxID=2153361 RepID=UPI000F56C392|nr:DNA-binding domain-containing protein [Paucibacter sp. KBW04]RQO59966.1 DUF2063 domain-containing protein [Paucibacter sp. KBW04]
MNTLQVQQQTMRLCLQGADAQQALSLAQTLLQDQAAPGLRAYREAYRARLLAALRDNYTVLQRLMGDEDFDALALAFLQAQPSQQPSIRWFGEGLAEFMAGPLYAEALAHPALIDCARMDWALRAAFDGPHAPSFTAERLRELAPEQWAGLTLTLQPTVQLLPMTWAIEPGWRLLRAWEPESGEDAPDLPEPQALDHVLLIWRQGLETRWRSLDSLEASLLRAVAAGQSFAVLCDLVAAVQPEAAAQLVVQALGGWLAEGLLAEA